MSTPSFGNNADAFTSGGSNVPTSAGNECQLYVTPNCEFSYLSIYWTYKLAPLQVSPISPSYRFYWMFSVSNVNDPKFL